MEAAELSFTSQLHDLVTEDGRGPYEIVFLAETSSGIALFCLDTPMGIRSVLRFKNHADDKLWGKLIDSVNLKDEPWRH